MERVFRLTLIILLTPFLLLAEEIPIYVIVKGKVEKLFVKKGQKVKKEQILLQISEELYSYELERLKGKLRELEIQHWKAKRDYKRYKEMFERDLLAESILEDKEAELKIIKFRIEQIKSEIKKVETLKSYTKVKSPFSGIVKEILVGEGSFVNGELRPHKVLIIKKEYA